MPNKSTQTCPPWTDNPQTSHTRAFAQLNPKSQRQVPGCGRSVIVLKAGDMHDRCIAPLKAVYARPQTHQRSADADRHPGGSPPW